MSPSIPVTIVMGHQAHSVGPWCGFMANQATELGHPAASTKTGALAETRNFEPEARPK